MKPKIIFSVRPHAQHLAAIILKRLAQNSDSGLW